jgi:hypothetical protein
VTYRLFPKKIDRFPRGAVFSFQGKYSPSFSRCRAQLCTAPAETFVKVIQGKKTAFIQKDGLFIYFTKLLDKKKKMVQCVKI